VRPVSIVGIGQIPVKKNYDLSLRDMGAVVVSQAMADAGVDEIDALYASNMLSDELQDQKHIAALIADQAGLYGIEAFQVRAATASGSAALRMAYLAVASGAVRLAVAVGVEKMTSGQATSALAKALDSKKEVPDGATMISQNARLMQLYLNRYEVPAGALACFSVNAHRNAASNQQALFQDIQFEVEDVLSSRIIMDPIRLLDCSPVCDGAAAVVLASGDVAAAIKKYPVKILGSSVAVDRFRMFDRAEPLELEAAKISTRKAFCQAGLKIQDIDLFELHDAFSIMACLSLEATNFAEPGQGWRLATEGEISLDGRIPISTLGGLKARGHPIGATALYQACEMVLQLSGQAGNSQISGAKAALMQSVGGAGTTIITHIFGI
jgi:acetyl-CoA C-acetyltransferase